MKNSNGMRIALYSYPMLFQRSGGLQVNVRETLQALREIGVDAKFFDWAHDKLTDFDVVHVLSSINGNHRVVEAARDAGVPAVVTSVLHPPFTRIDRHRAKLASRIAGKITGWQSRTSYDEIHSCLHHAHRVIAKGQKEKAMLETGYDVPSDRIAVIPNGVGRRFFEPDPSAFRKSYGLTAPFILCCASISPYKNQLGLSQAAVAAGVNIVLAGGCTQDNRLYLDRCLSAGGGYVSYIGELAHDSGLLPSAYGAAYGFALPSKTEVAPLAVLEALAAGRPAILTRNHSLEIEAGNALREVDHTDVADITAGLRWLGDGAASPRECADVVAGATWPKMAERIVAQYQAVTREIGDGDGGAT